MNTKVRCSSSVQSHCVLVHKRTHYQSRKPLHHGNLNHRLLYLCWLFQCEFHLPEQSFDNSHYRQSNY
ncbi:Uncharacterised protein [Vibrio cholerae]|nr:Uncharacterised protein [Vibrio cholerae]CSI58065.1 Uncharacterised protein [Vibrio cholerae]